MSLASCLTPFLRPALQERAASAILSSACLRIRHTSTQPEKPPTPEKPSLPLSKKPPKVDLGYFTLRETANDPLEPANSKDAADHVLKPLARPIGLTIPPQPGQNTGEDTRTFQQKRDEFFNYDKHLERRKELTRKIARPYYRDWSRLQFNQGKIFYAPTRLIRADRALYFPNLRGVTLANTKVDQDTTTVARGQITLVSVYTGTWGAQQAKTWLEDEGLKKLFEHGKGVLQRIDLNVEQNRMKSAIVRMFMPGLRKTHPVDMHKNYFLIRRGFEEEYKHALGMYNAMVGHVFLLDDNCKIRWGGSGEAQEDEKVNLRKGIVKLVQELKDECDKGQRRIPPTTRQTVSKFVARIPSLLT